MAERRVYRREGTGLEFDRVAFFSDAIFAIAMTVIAVGIGAPVVKDTSSMHDLWQALSDKEGEVLTFFISFWVLGSFWIAHHRFFSRLDAMDGRLRGLNLVYLAFVAFLPFPAQILGQYSDNSVAVAFYAMSVGAISLMETFMLRHAHTAGLGRVPLPGPVATWGTLASLVPVVFFAISIPIAFIDPLAGIFTWAASIPGEMLLTRFKPPGTDDYFD